MKTLVYGTQSSGASLITYFLSQIPRSLGIVDIWSNAVAPNKQELRVSGNVGAIFLKAVITTDYSLDDHIQSSRPDRTLLVLRHPYHTYKSLLRKHYADHGGSPEAKLSVLEDTFRNRDQFDETILYEQFVLGREEAIDRLSTIHSSVKESFYDFPRSPEEVVDFNRNHIEWCDRYFRARWGFGNVTGGRIRKDRIFKFVRPRHRRVVRSQCPSLCAFYRRFLREEVSRLTYWRSVLRGDLLPTANSMLQEFLDVDDA